MSTHGSRRYLDRPHSILKDSETDFAVVPLGDDYNNLCKSGSGSTTMASVRKISSIEALLWRLTLGEQARYRFANFIRLGAWVVGVDARVDKLYNDDCHKSYATRNPIIGFFIVVFVLILGPALTILLLNSDVGNTSILYMTRMFHVQLFTVNWIVALILGITLIYSQAIPFSRQHPELTLFTCTLLLPIGSIVWLFLVNLDAYINQNELYNKISISTGFQIKLWTDTYIWSVLYLMLLFFDAIASTRTHHTFGIHLGLMILISFVRLYTILTFKDYEAMMIIPAIITIQTQQTVLAIVFIALCYMIRYQNEAKERLKTAVVVLENDRLSKLRAEQLKVKRGKGATIMENLMDKFKKAQAEVLSEAYSNNRNGDLKLLQISEQFEFCVELLKDTDDLYATGKNIEDGGEPGGKFFEQYGRRKNVVFENTDETAMDRILPYEAKKIKLLGEQGPKIDADSNPLRYVIGENISANILTMIDRENLLVEVGLILLDNYLASFETDRCTMKAYLYSLQTLYPLNPYHNQCHGANVAHCASTYANMLKMTDNSPMMGALILSALGHDAGHPGKNNQYIVSSQSLLSIIYQSSWLENYHSFLTFRTATISAGTNIYKHMTRSDYQKVRQWIIQLILSTDMAEHFNNIGKFRAKRENEKFNPRMNDGDKFSVYKMIMKISDLAHTMVDWEQHWEWSIRVMMELYLQGDLEKKEGYPVSPLCDRDQHYDFAKSQAGFIHFVVVPLANELCEIDVFGEFANEVSTKLMFNCNKWDLLKEKGVLVDIPNIQQHELCSPETGDAVLLRALLSKSLKDWVANPFDTEAFKIYRDQYENTNIRTVSDGSKLCRIISPTESDSENTQNLLEYDDLESQEYSAIENSCTSSVTENESGIQTSESDSENEKSTYTTSSWTSSSSY